MNFVHITKNKGIAKVELKNKKVNSINEELIEELFHCFENIENDDDINSVILTGKGKFFSFGFDIPEFLNWPKNDFKRFLKKFTGFYTYLFLFPKPVIAALNGHTIAGGCMIALACDYRIMISGKSKISLNEINFGSSVFAGSTEMLRFTVGSYNASKILYSGQMYTAVEAKEIGLIDAISDEKLIQDDAYKKTQEYFLKSHKAFSSIKKLLRNPIAREMKQNEIKSIDNFIEIWYSDYTQQNLQKIKIY